MLAARIARLAPLGLLLALAGGARGTDVQGGAESPDPLSADAAAGRVLDREGNVARRAVLADRWGVAAEGARLEPGDWVRAGARGANAAKLALAGGAELILGPGGLLEVVDGARVVLQQGELEASPPDGGALVVAGPRDSEVEVRGRVVLRAGVGGLERLDEQPRWLAGYRAGASTEALGSLLCSIDGRDVPLTMGYHQVTVDVRDQIARTVIEESFENHLEDVVLEGVFYFPLPADASISGFGMWVGGELVQGEIIEKQRAREIYETILREKRDPGLLEWSGGNVFKARVYPISAGGEKRIRISYTQVLSKEGDTYAYRYALQSDLLRQHPLRLLRIQVDVSSTEPLAEVRSSSHACRVRTTEHAARVELELEEYSPDRDFELVVRGAAPAGAVTLVPHRRADDGYFMLLVEAPRRDGEQARQRTEPIELIVLADTSGSMWGPARAAQEVFVEALLGALGPQDVVDLATCDVETRFAFGSSRACSPGAREEALRFLEQREPLGWTDLERAFRQACERAGPRTHVVYVGDGAPTSGDPDPAAFARSLAGLYGGQGSFHAVVPGSTSEPLVLSAIAALGGGSRRALGDDPAAAAFALLAEISAPAVKDLRLHFEGFEVAAVHPERLPNLPAGRQQVVLGRFDPRGGDLAGRVRVTGTLDGASVELAADVTLRAGEEGNSFVPRLWARRQLDHLLAQGSSEDVQGRVIALSEDFQIATPYTSFLVLESDADRERFGVEKRFRMRDGEEFFAQGRDTARHDLVRAQMQAAKGWRRRLQARTLRTLSGLGRELTELLRVSGGQANGVEYLGALRSLGYVGEGEAGAVDHRLAFYEESDRGDRSAVSDEAFLDAGLDQDGYLAEEEAREVSDLPMSSESNLERQLAKRESVASRPNAPSTSGPSSPGPAAFEIGRYRGPGDTVPPGGGGGRRAWTPEPFQGLFGEVAAPRGPDPEWRWQPEVSELATRLDRRALVEAGPRGWSFEVESTSVDLRGREWRTSATHLVGAGVWMETGPRAEGASYQLRWLADGTRGVLAEGWRLGRTRSAQDGDARAWSAPFGWHFGEELRGHAGYEATLEDVGEGRVRIVLRNPADPEAAVALLVERERAVLLEVTWSRKGETTARRTFGALTEVGGAWWPAEVRSYDRDGRETTVARIRVETLTPDGLEQRVAAALSGRADAILLGPDAEDVQVAKQAVREGRATLEERWLLLRHFARTQRWEEAAPHLAAVEELAAGKPGLFAIRAAYLQLARRNEELRLHLLAGADRLAASERAAELDLAAQMVAYGNNLNRGNERRALLVALEPVFDRHPGALQARLRWERWMLQALQAMNRPEQVFAQWERMARAHPFAADVQAGFARELAPRRGVDAALAWLAAAEAEGGPWSEHELGQLRTAVLDVLWNGYRLEQLVETSERWMREEPDRSDQQALSRLLTALTYLDREERADALLDEWLALAERAELDTPARNRLQAAVNHALNGGYGIWRRSRFGQRDAERLAGAVGSLARRDDLGHLAGQILTHWRFRRTDAARALLAELLGELDAELELLPARRLEQWVQWVRGSGHPTTGSEQAWNALLERVLARWEAETEQSERAPLERIVLAHGARALVLRHHRRALETAKPGPERVEAAYRLSAYLMQGEWSSEAEDELVALLPALALDEAPDEAARERDLERRIVALYDLAGWLPRARAKAAVAALPDVNLLARRELETAREQALREARVATLGRLAALEPSIEPELLRPWVGIERAWLQVKTGTDVEAARAWALATLTGLEEAHAAHEQADGVPLRDRVLALRCSATLAWLVVRASEEERAPHQAALRAVIASGGDHGSALADWQELEATLLLVLDRAEELEQRLAEWFAGGEDLERIRWGRSLAFVHAERGALERAVELLEGVERLDQLTHGDLRALSDWLTALDRPEAAREARIRSWETLGESALSSRLWSDVRAQQRSGDQPPPELDPEVPLRLIALLRKASQPSRHLGTLQQLYAATKDFRLLECVPEGVLGHSAQGIYPYLEVSGALFDLIQEEATVDRLQAHLLLLRERARTEVDARALRLLEFAMLRRAADQSHGTERHAEGALAALRAAEQGTWAEGEPGLMARFLAGEGRLRQEELASEQLRLLATLRASATDPDERLDVNGYLAATLWAYELGEEATRVLEAALDARREAAGGRLPHVALRRMETLCSWLQSLGSWPRAEALWKAELEAGHPQDSRRWVVRELHELYRDAVLARADLAIGAGRALYTAVMASFERELALRADEDHARHLVATLCDLWQRAHHELRLAAAREDAALFAFRGLPDVLALYQYRDGQQMVASVAECLHKVNGARTALEFLVVRAENEPAWLALIAQDFWRQHGGRLADLREKAGAIDPTLEARVLAIVLRELREDLRSRESRNRAAYAIHSGDFWKEKRPEFLRTALEVLAEQRDSGPGVAYAARYLYEGLDAHDEAIAALADARRRGVLEHDGRRLLARYLQERSRWLESLPVLAELLEDSPEDAGLRVMQMRAHFHLGDREQLIAALERGEAWLREHELWIEDPIATLASGCVETELFERGIALFAEAIALHVRTAPGRGVGDGVLSRYYREQASALAGLGRTAEAVDAAAGAIVSWGRHADGRAQDLAMLRRVLAQSEDLEGYVARLEAEVASTGLENPIVRKALGQVLVERKRFDLAAHQLRSALAAQPDDGETHDLLVRAYEGMRRPDLAVAALLERARLAAHDVDLYTRLGRRFAALERQLEAERAWTSLVEALPNESEGHQRLAEIRQEQRRFDEAATRWRQVVRVRTTEPTGYLGLAECLLALERWEEAREVARTLLATSWPERFGDVHARGEELLRRIPRGG